MMSPKQRMHDDPTFAALVEHLYTWLCKGDFTPTEIREAIMMAQIKFETMHPRPLPLNEDIRNWLEGNTK